MHYIKLNKYAKCMKIIYNTIIFVIKFEDNKILEFHLNPSLFRNNLEIILIDFPVATQSARVAEHYGFCAIVSRELVRHEVSTGSHRGVSLAYLMSEGKLVPSDVMMELIKAQMLSSIDTTRGFLLSGFPREKIQCQHFNRQVRPPDLVLYLYVRNSVLMDRVLARTVTATERQNRGIEQNWRRIKNHSRTIKSILRYYKKQLVVIDGEKDETEVFQDICRAIDNILMNFPSTSGKSS